MVTPYARPVKRSITIAGHETAVTLEPIYWAALHRVAAMQRVPLNALVARIDAERIAALDPPSLASALRCWLFALGGGGDPYPERPGADRQT